MHTHSMLSQLMLPSRFGIKSDKGTRTFRSFDPFEHLPFGNGSFVTHGIVNDRALLALGYSFQQRCICLLDGTIRKLYRQIRCC